MKKILDKDLRNNENEIIIHRFLAFLITLCVLLVIGYFLKFIPDKLDVEFITKTYNLRLGDFIPEKRELLQYVISTILFPILFCVFFKLLSMFNIKRTNKKIMLLEYIQIILIFVIFILGIYILPINWRQNVLSILSIILLLSVFLYQKSKAKWTKAFSVIIFTIEMATIFFLSWLYITKNYFINDNGIYQAWHFDAYYYPVFEVFNGKTPLVDFNCLYGFYPYILAPILKLFGEISMFNFSILMALLVFVVFSSIVFFLWSNIKNKVITLIGLFAIMFNANIFYSISKGYYLQYNPHRMIGPAILLLICSLYINTKKKVMKTRLEVVGYVVGAFSLFWNIDTGVVVIAAWTLLLMYNVGLEYELKDKKFYIKCLKIVGFSALSVLATLVTLVIITLARTGQLIGLKDILSGQLLFLGSGFFMLPMPLIGPWILLVLIFAVGLAKSLSNLAFMRNSDNNYSKEKNSLYFILSVLGLGLFSYYQGRSHEDVFNVVIWPGVILACLFADEYINNISTYNRNLKKRFLNMNTLNNLAKIIIMLTIISSFAASFIGQTIDKQIIKNMAISTFLPVPEYNLALVDYFKKNTNNNEQINILTKYFEEYYTMLGTKNPMDVRSAIDWFTKDDYSQVIKMLETTNNKVFIDSFCSDLLKQYTPTEFENVLKKRFILKENYRDIDLYELKAT